ncbi:MAG: histidinol dehydrogenase [Chloroflexia bacterium]|nr:histidinol dehydrogenase [Chloroflexia bacterium]
MIERIEGLEAGLARLSRRGGVAEQPLPEHFARRILEVFGEPLTAAKVVARIIADVRAEGDVAVRRFTLAFDGVEPASFEAPRETWEWAWDEIGPELRSALTIASDRIRSFHEKQTRPSWFDPDEFGIFGQIVRPLDCIGVYTPGGSAALPSSLLMTAIPARVAGVREIVVSAPPGRDGRVAPIILAAARTAGVDRVVSIGGAQAIAALAYGTRLVPKVDKILGPGNVFVATAKQQVFGAVDIDQIAGPTETLLIADHTADIELVAADMLAQSEHGEDSSAVLITTSTDLAGRIDRELEVQLARLARAGVARASLENHSVVVVVEQLADAVALSNAYAPEHLCLLVQDPWTLVPAIENAGGIFIGESSPEALGDYTAGPSHVMPTGGTARFSSPVNVSDFQKVISVIAANHSAVESLGPATIALANSEGLGGHAAAIERRLRRTESSQG